MALASLEIFRNEKVLEKMQPKILTLKRRLEQDFLPLVHVGDVRQWGFMIGIELVEEKVSLRRYPPEKRMAHRVILEARRRGVVVPVKKSFNIPILSKKGREYLLRSESGRQRKIATGDPLSQTEEIWANILMLAGEHPPSTTKAGSDLVDNKQNPVPAAYFAQGLYIAWGLCPHPGRALH